MAVGPVRSRVDYVSDEDQGLTFAIASMQFIQFMVNNQKIVQMKKYISNVWKFSWNSTFNGAAIVSGLSRKREKKISNRAQKPPYRTHSTAKADVFLQFDIENVSALSCKSMKYEEKLVCICPKFIDQRVGGLPL